MATGRDLSVTSKVPCHPSSVAQTVRTRCPARREGRQVESHPCKARDLLCWNWKQFAATQKGALERERQALQRKGRSDCGRAIELQPQPGMKGPHAGALPLMGGGEEQTPHSCRDSVAKL